MNIKPLAYFDECETSNLFAYVNYVIGRATSPAVS
jgi:hypothetical protein